MNEKIKELLEQARTECRQPGSKPATTVGYDELEKLFELLVFECVNAVMDGTKEGDHYAQRIEQHFDNGPGGVLHFGVEE
jgi:hypothetical protein